jgi:hypothetical protein
VTVLDEKSEVQDILVVSGLDEVRALGSQLREGERIETEHLVTEEPLEHALGSVKRSLLAIEHALRVDHGLHFENLELWLTGETNFRDVFATIRPYKGNREKVSRPVHYEAIRAYLKRRWGAQVTEGIEADDRVAEISYFHKHNPDAVCVVSPDKDLLTVPGRLYNFRAKPRDRMRIVSPDQARVNFYRQVLTGDATDNVLGCYKTGPKTAEKIVTMSQTEEASARLVLEEFEASVKRAGCPYTDAKAAFLETGRLLHLRRFNGDLWAPPWDRQVKYYGKETHDAEAS